MPILRIREGRLQEIKITCLGWGLDPGPSHCEVAEAFPPFSPPAWTQCPPPTPAWPLIKVSQCHPAFASFPERKGDLYLHLGPIPLILVCLIFVFLGLKVPWR